MEIELQLLNFIIAQQFMLGMLVGVLTVITVALIAADITEIVKKNREKQEKVFQQRLQLELAKAKKR